MQKQHFPEITTSDDLTPALLDEFGQHLSDVMAVVEVGISSDLHHRLEAMKLTS